MGAMKHAEIMMRRDEILNLKRHAWFFIQRGRGSIGDRVDLAMTLFEYAADYARTLNSADHAIDAIENPRDYAEEIAWFIGANGIADADAVSEIGYWECEACQKISTIMNHEISAEKTCSEE